MKNQYYFSTKINQLINLIQFCNIKLILIQPGSKRLAEIIFLNKQDPSWRQQSHEIAKELYIRRQINLSCYSWNETKE